jgi:hypothetical protein
LRFTQRIIYGINRSYGTVLHGSVVSQVRVDLLEGRVENIYSNVQSLLAIPVDRAIGLYPQMFSRRIINKLDK